MTDQAKHNYDAGNIKILGGLEAVRKRPDMYIGDRGQDGLHHLVYEVVDNSIDEALGGFCDLISVTIEADGSCVVEDNGRGIPVTKHEKTGTSALEVVLTTLHAGGKFDSDSYKVAGGLHGVGLSVVNALSLWLDADVYRQTEHWHFKCRRGIAENSAKKIGSTEKTGTKITFKPDVEIFKDAKFKYEILEKRLRELAYLNAGIKIMFHDKRCDKKEIFQFENGLKAFVTHLNEGKETLHQEVIHFIKEDTENMLVCEVAMQYNDSYTENTMAYANNIRNIDGGTHLSGFKTALTRTMNYYAKKNNLLKGADATTGDDLREGLTAVISVKVADPHFEAQTKVRLTNPEVGSFVETTVNEKINLYLEEHPTEAKRILNKAIQAAAARAAARKARDLTRRKGALSGSNLPGKLWDCSSKEKATTEIFIVEGNSAGGSAKAGRDRKIQAILPLKGKILNVEKARIEKMLSHEEIRTIISALGTGIGTDVFDIEKCRYGKIVLMTDADIDGAHIRTLLMTFFFRQMPQLFENNMIYVAQPPLYEIKPKGAKKGQYILNEAQMQKTMAKRGIDGTTLVIREQKEEKFQIQTEQLTLLMEKLNEAEQCIAILARRGIVFEQFMNEYLKNGKLPIFRIVENGNQEVFYEKEPYEQKRADIEQKQINDENPNDAVVVCEEMRELETLHEIMTQLKDEYQLALTDFCLKTEQNVAGQMLPTKFVLKNPAGDKEVANLKEIAAAIRQIGATGVEIKRFKGLGEMNADELWETTMNPKVRTLLQIKTEDAGEADRMFSILMGSDVEKRRNFIRDHALEVQNLDV